MIIDEFPWAIEWILSKTAGWHRHIFRPNRNISINICKHYCLKSSFRRFSTNINSATDFHIFCKSFRSNFFSHSTEKLRRGTLLCFRKILLSKIFMHRGGGITVLSNFFLCLAVPKNFVGEHFCVSEKFWYRKFSCIGGGIMILSEIFRLTAAKNFVRGPFCASEIF